MLFRDNVAIQGMGRVDESSGIQPATLTLTLRNADGRFTPKNGSGAYSPNILRNTRIRVSVNATSATGVAYNQFRFFGEVSSWPVINDVSQRDVTVTVTAAGIWRRISQSSVPLGSAYSRYLDQLTSTSVPAAAWPMEDGNGSTVFITAIGSSAAATFTGTPSFAADGTSFPGCDALPVANGARVTATVTSAATPVNTVVRFALSVPAAGDSSASTFALGGEVAKILSPSATIKRYDVSLVGNQLVLHGYTAVTGGTAAFTGVITTKVNGVPVLVSVEAAPSGGSINWALRIIKPGAGAVLDQVTGTRATSTIAAVTQVFLDGQGRLADSAIGQLGVWYTIPSLVTAASAISGFTGEFAVDRFNRLCAETGIAATVIGSASAAMGPQQDDTLANILLDIENTDGGLLYESRDQFGLGYRTLASMKDQAAAVTISYTAGVLGAPLAPVYDDALIRNQWTVTNYDGYAAQATLTAGAVSVLDVPNGVGLYSGSASVNTSSHAQVNAIAQQRLFQGTVDDIRDPSMVISFLRKQAAPFFASVPGLRIGDHVQVTNRPAYDGATTSKQLAWGYSEVLTGMAWAITFNMVPELPFETAFSPGTFSVVQAPSGGVAAGGSQVGSSVSVSQLPPGSPGSTGSTISARSAGGVTSFISAATPYDWTFTVTGTPADVTYFSCTTEQALPIAVGDTFTNLGGLGGPFTVTAIASPSAGTANIYFTPDASSVMSTGTVQGGKDGDTWVNSSGGYQVSQWASGAWVSITWNAANVLQAGTVTATQIAALTITAAQIAAGIVIAGIVDATTITGAVIQTAASTPAVIMDGSRDAIFGYNAATGLLFSLAGAGGTDFFGHVYPQGLFSQQATLADQASAPSAVSGATVLYSSNAGRLKYLASNGENNIIERGGINVATFTVGNTTTPTIISGNLGYKGAASSNQSSTFEIEISGAFHTGATTVQQSLFQLFSDAAGIGNTVTIGAAALNVNVWYDYAVRFRISVLSYGSSGTAVVTCDGTVAQQAVAIGSVTNTHLAIGTTNSSVSFNSTIDHTLTVYAWFNGTQTSQEFDTFITRTTNYS